MANKIEFICLKLNAKQKINHSEQNFLKILSSFEIYNF